MIEDTGATGVAEFLRRHPPFSALDAGELADVAQTVAEQRFGAGDVVLLEDGPPASALYVIRGGSMELVHEAEIVDILEPGESFGHPSLLTGLAPAFTVRAHEPSVCYLVPRETALSVLGSRAGAGFIAETLRDRLTRTGHVVHGLPPLGTVRVVDLITRPPVFAEAFATIGHAARTMTEQGASAALVRDGERLHILTDADLRSKVLAAELSVENPITRVTNPAVVVPPDRLAVDVVVDMLDAGVDHVVVVDARREVLGIVSAGDLLGVETRSPFALRHAVLRARDEEELVEASRRLPKLLLALVDAGVGAADIGRVLSLQLDALTSRLIDFSIWRNGPAPVSWAWLLLGSGARRELTLASDQEHGLAYAEGDAGSDAYFRRLGEEVARGLERCGFAADPNGVLASHAPWRLPEAAWVDVFRSCFESPDRSHLIRATVAFDFRHGGGGLEIVPPLVAELRRAPEHPDFLRRLARTATDYRPPLGFRGSLSVAREGDEAGKLDVKRGGVLPIANLARFHALANRVTISATLDRLVAVEELGALEAEIAQSLRQAFELTTRIRLEHHAAQIGRGVPPDNLVDPDELPPLTRVELREAFRAIAQAQKRLGVYVPAGL